MHSSIHVDFVCEQVELLQLRVILDGGLKLKQQSVVHVTAVEGERLQLLFVFEGLQEYLACVLELLEIVVGEEEVSEPGVRGEAACQQAEGILAHVVVTHVYLQNITVAFQGLGYWLDLLVGQLVFEQVQVFEW